MEMKPSVWTNILVFMLTAEAQIVKLSRYVTLTDHTSCFLVLYNLDVKSLVFLKNKYIVHVCIDTNIHLVY